MSEHRKFVRIPFRRPVSYDSIREVPVEGGSQMVKGGCLGCDVSKGGLRSTINRFVPLNTSLLLNFSIDPQHSIELEGKVVWVQKVPNGENYQIGMQFVDSDINFEAQTALDKFLKKE